MTSVRVPRVLQPQEDVQMPEVHEDPLQQRHQRLTTSQRQSAEDIYTYHMDARVDQLRQ